MILTELNSDVNYFGMFSYTEASQIENPKNMLFKDSRITAA